MSTNEIQRAQDSSLLSPEEYQKVIEKLNDEDAKDAYNPLKTTVIVDKRNFVVKNSGAEEPIAEYREMDVHIIGAKKARVCYTEEDQKVPTCFSSDYIHGNLNAGYANQVPEGVGDLCSACPFNQWGSDMDKDGNPRDGKRCKERRNVLLLHTDFTLPLVLSLAPSSIGRWDSFADTLAKRRPPSNPIEYITHLSIETKKDGVNEYGIARFSTRQPLLQEEVLATIPLRKQYADWLERVQVETKDVLGEEEELPGT